MKMEGELITYNDKLETGMVCPESGFWVCKVHVDDNEKYIHKGDRLPKCSHVAGHNAVWWRIEPRKK